MSPPVTAAVMMHFLFIISFLRFIGIALFPSTKLFGPAEMAIQSGRSCV